MRRRYGIVTVGLLAALAAIPTALQGTASAIVNGKKASYIPPGMVEVHASTTGNSYNQCGGTLIDAKWVITAAHCAEANGGAKSIDVLTGWKTGSWGNRKRVETWYIQQGYDLALLKLKDTVTLPDNDLKKTATLSKTDPGVGSTGYVYGWGTNEKGTMGGPLKWAQVNVTGGTSWCRDGAGGPGLCASGVNGYPAAGDSGGPLYDVNEKVVGVFSHSSGNSTSYVSVASRLAWINQKTGLKLG